jgi:hypothetical protein
MHRNAVCIRLLEVAVRCPTVVLAPFWIVNPSLFSKRGTRSKEVPLRVALWGILVPIRPYLAGRAFEPEVVAEMGIALERACGAMGLRYADDHVTRLVAQKVIQLVERGVVGADKISSQAIQELTGRE